MGSADIRNGKGHRAYRRKRAALRRRVAAESLNCAWCGKSFDLTLPDTSRMGFTADHPTALNNGGHLVTQDLAPFHNVCNALKGDSAEVEIWGAT
jgi:hypothetical protein